MDGVAYRPALANGAGEGLLGVDVEAGPCGGDGRQCVPVVGQCNENCVEVAAAD
jgi:hypothetical protein